MSQITRARLAPLTGVVAVILLLVALILEGSPPAADAPTEEVVRYHAENDATLLAASLIGSLSSVFLAWFGGSVFAAFRSVEGEPGRLGAIAFGGILLASAGNVMLFGFVFAPADTVGDVPAEVTQTLSVLGALFVLPLAVGVLVALLASAVAVLRHRALPSWVGYVSMLVAVVYVVSAAFGAEAAITVWIVTAMVWTVILSAALFLREPRPAEYPRNA